MTNYITDLIMLVMIMFIMNLKKNYRTFLYQANSEENWRKKHGHLTFYLPTHNLFFRKYSQ